MKKIKIPIPEGFELNLQESDKNNAIVQEKVKYPQSWEDCTYRFSIRFETRFNPSEFIANLMEKTSAYTKLLCLRHEWIHIWSEEQNLGKDWEPDWKSRRQCKYCLILFENNEVMMGENIRTVRSLSFPTMKMAEEFRDCFKDLLEQAKGLY